MHFFGFVYILVGEPSPQKRNGRRALGDLGSYIYLDRAQNLVTAGSTTVITLEALP